MMPWVFRHLYKCHLKWKWSIKLIAYGCDIIDEDCKKLSKLLEKYKI